MGEELHELARCADPRKQASGAHLFRPLRQVIESINQTFKGQLDLEGDGGHTPAGVVVRVLQRILALTAAILIRQCVQASLGHADTDRNVTNQRCSAYAPTASTSPAATTTAHPSERSSPPHGTP